MYDEQDMKLHAVCVLKGLKDKDESVNMPKVFQPGKAFLEGELLQVLAPAVPPVNCTERISLYIFPIRCKTS